jgi:hypothetical protein
MEYQEDRGFRILKFIVKFMGIVLVAGVFFLFYVVMKRIENPDFMRLNPRCGLAGLESLSVDGTVTAMTETDKNLMLLVTKGDHTQAILTIDRCSGNIEHRLPIVDGDK